MNSKDKFQLGLSDEVSTILQNVNSDTDSLIHITYPSGNLKLEIEIENGSLSLGAHTEFYDKRYKYFFATEIDTFSSENPMIKTFYFADQNGVLIYQRMYDEKARPIYSIGDLIVITKTNSNKLYVFDTLLTQIYVVSEPYPARYDDLERELTFQIIKDNSIIKTYKPRISEEHSCYFTNEVFETPGKYKIRGIVKFNDIVFKSDEYFVNSTMTDTTEFEIFIIDKENAKENKMPITTKASYGRNGPDYASRHEASVDWRSATEPLR